MVNSLNSILSNIYYNPLSPGSYGGVERLLHEAQKVDYSINRRFVQDWLQKQIVYTLHKTVRHKFKRNPIIAEKINENFQADLVDMQDYSRQNDGYKYLLTCVDVFSKRAWVSTLKSKSKEEVAKAMEKIIEVNCPSKLQTDKGKEFDNTVFKKLMEKFKINHFFAQNKEIKCSIIERFNKTLKNRIFRRFTEKGNNGYIEELQDFITSYNNSEHSSINMKPNDVNRQNSKQVFKNLYGYENKRMLLKSLKNGKIKLDSNVRKKYVREIMDRGFFPNWSDEIFKVQNIVKGLHKPQYILKNERGNILTKRFYPEEIQKVKQQKYRIEKILRTRKRKGIKESYVKWLNHPTSENSWVISSTITSINGN